MTTVSPGWVVDLLVEGEVAGVTQLQTAKSRGHRPRLSFQAAARPAGRSSIQRVASGTLQLQPQERGVAHGRRRWRSRPAAPAQRPERRARAGGERRRCGLPGLVIGRSRGRAAGPGRARARRRRGQRRRQQPDLGGDAVASVGPGAGHGGQRWPARGSARPAAAGAVRRELTRTSTRPTTTRRTSVEVAPADLAQGPQHRGDAPPAR